MADKAPYVEPHPYWVYFIHPDMGWQRAGTWGSEVEAFAEVEYWQEKGFEAYVVQVAVT